jgi:predicted amidohydrolase
MNLYLDGWIESGADAGRGNLLGIQPYMLAADYASEETFFEKIDGYLEAARQKGWLNPCTVAVLPEYLGSWLVILGENPRVTQAQTIQQAMRPIVLGNLRAFIRDLWSARENNKINASVFRIKAARMGRAYQAVFSKLAAKYGVTIVGGSILLPSPTIRAGVITPGQGSLYNVSAVFKPDGQVHPLLSVKAFPVAAELPFLASGSPGSLPVFETPAGRLGVLVCADSFYPQAYQQMKALKADLIAVPSFSTGTGLWNQPWGSYSGAEAPADVDPADTGRLTEGEAWHKYALLGRMASAGVNYGVNVFLHGELWDLEAENSPSIIVNGQDWVESVATRAALLNLWL